MPLQRAVWIERPKPTTFKGAWELLEKPPGDAILQREHDGVAVVERSELRGYLNDLMSLERQDHQVLWPERREVVRGGDVARDEHRTVWFDQLHPVSSNRLEIARTRNHAHLLARESQTNAEQTTNSPRTYDAHAHQRTLLTNHFRHCTNTGAWTRTLDDVTEGRAFACSWLGSLAERHAG